MLPAFAVALDSCAEGDGGVFNIFFLRPVRRLPTGRTRVLSNLIASSVSCTRPPCPRSCSVLLHYNFMLYSVSAAGWIRQPGTD